MLREHEIDEYVAKDGRFCPYCNKDSIVITSDTVSWWDGRAETGKKCAFCNKEWSDVYQLNGIKEFE